MNIDDLSEIIERICKNMDSIADAMAGMSITQVKMLELMVDLKNHLTAIEKKLDNVGFSDN